MREEKSLKTTLVEYLKKGATTLLMPRLELSVVSVTNNSVFVTDDGIHSFELVGSF